MYSTPVISGKADLPSQDRCQVQSPQWSSFQCCWDFCTRRSYQWLGTVNSVVHLHRLAELADIEFNGQLEAKYADPSAGKPGSLRFTLEIPSTHPYGPPSFLLSISPSRSAMLTKIRRAGLTLTQSWNTANILNTKLELDNKIAKGLKAEALTVRSHPHLVFC